MFLGVGYSQCDANGDGDLDVLDVVIEVDCILTDCWEADTSIAQASINMEMSEDLKLTISIDNFSSSNYMNLVIDFDDNLSFQNYSLGDGISLFFESVFNNEIFLAFESLPMNSFELINIQFEAESNYENAMIYLSEIEILDNNMNHIYYSCSNTAYNTPNTCIQNGGSWNINSDELFVENYLCYELVNNTYIWTNSCNSTP